MAGYALIFRLAAAAGREVRGRSCPKRWRSTAPLVQHHPAAESAAAACRRLPPLSWALSGRWRARGRGARAAAEPPAASRVASRLRRCAAAPQTALAGPPWSRLRGAARHRDLSLALSCGGCSRDAMRNEKSAAGRVKRGRAEGLQRRLVYSPGGGGAAGNLLGEEVPRCRGGRVRAPARRAADEHCAPQVGAQ